MLFQAVAMDFPYFKLFQNFVYKVKGPLQYIFYLKKCKQRCQRMLNLSNLIRYCGVARCSNKVILAYLLYYNMTWRFRDHSLFMSGVGVETKMFQSQNFFLPRAPSFYKNNFDPIF